MKNKKLIFMTQSAVIAALYAALTLSQGVLFPYLTFGPVQFRVSELLCVLAIFTPAAIPGLTIGCIIGNVVSSLGFFDMVFGPIASLLAALTMYALRNVRWFRIPFLSLLMPAVFNGVIVGFMIELIDAITRIQTEHVDFVFNGAEFLIFGGEVALGELGVLFILGIPMTLLLDKYGAKIGIKKS